VLHKFCDSPGISCGLARRRAAQEMHTIPQELPSRFRSHVKNFIQMKTQLMESTETIELVPQILRLKKILVPIDFSDTSKKAFHYALRFAEQFDCEITLLNVVEPISPMAGEPAAVEACSFAKREFSLAEKNLAVLAAGSHTNGASSVHSLVRIGHAPNEITKAAKELDVDLIIIATHGYTSWRHLCIGSTSERVVRSAPCPVLVVREKEHDFL
jgi:nucleotide-binding universal stress UspA family protein